MRRNLSMMCECVNMVNHALVPAVYSTSTADVVGKNQLKTAVRGGIMFLSKHPVYSCILVTFKSDSDDPT